MPELDFTTSTRSKCFAPSSERMIHSVTLSILLAGFSPIIITICVRRHEIATLLERIRFSVAIRSIPMSELTRRHSQPAQEAQSTSRELSLGATGVSDVKCVSELPVLKTRGRPPGCRLTHDPDERRPRRRRPPRPGVIPMVLLLLVRPQPHQQAQGLPTTQPRHQRRRHSLPLPEVRPRQLRVTRDGGRISHLKTISQVRRAQVHDEVRVLGRPRHRQHQLHQQEGLQRTLQPLHRVARQLRITTNTMQAEKT